MTRERTTSFEDPVLKQAVVRAWGEETAPASLRRRVESLVAGMESDAVAPAALRIPTPWWRSGIMWSVAASVLVGSGIIAIQLGRTSKTQSISQSAVASALSLPSDLGDQLVKCHDRCIRHAANDHHFLKNAPKDNFKAIASAMTTDLKYPVVATAMGHDWDFRGAAECMVGSTKSAHLLYARGDAFVSVFSLPSSSLSSCSDHGDCELALSEHPLAGFVESGAFYCVVASSGGKTHVDPIMVRAMRDQLRADVVASLDARIGGSLAMAH